MKANFFATAVLVTLLGAPLAASAQADDAAIQKDVQKILHDKRFSGVHANVSSAVVTLDGNVSLLWEKMDAEKKVLKDKEVASVKNNLVVNVEKPISDPELFQKLGSALANDRVGYGTTMFNAISLQVRGGVVELSGVVVLPADKESAIALVQDTPGVRGLVDKLIVAPPSSMDDRVRRDEARAIYGASQLTKYAIVPSKPIRITVMSGHVTLSGVVDNQGDKDLAYIRANGVGGVFSVQNNLQVAGQVEH